MTPLLKKLNLGSQAVVQVLNAPPSFEPEGIVAIDPDWPALRFRRIAYIKTLSRKPSGVISAAGQRRATAGTR